MPFCRFIIGEGRCTKALPHTRVQTQKTDRTKKKKTLQQGHTVKITNTKKRCFKSFYEAHGTFEMHFKTLAQTLIKTCELPLGLQTSVFFLNTVI